MKQYDVDALLDSLTVTEFAEWQAFFTVKAELENPKVGKGTERNRLADKDVGLKILGSLRGYQKQRDKLKAQGRLK